MNRFEILEAVERTQLNSIVGRAARILKNFQETVDQNSDGWPYWTPARNAAKRLIAVVELHRPRNYAGEIALANLAEKDMTKALIPDPTFLQQAQIGVSDRRLDLMAASAEFGKRGCGVSVYFGSITAPNYVILTSSEWIVGGRKRSHQGEE